MIPPLVAGHRCSAGIAATFAYGSIRALRRELLQVGKGVLTLPKTTSKGKPKKDELPSTLRKSDAKAQRTFAEAHDSAVDTYGEGERAHRVAYSALKHSFEKVGDHWEAKAKRGPSDQRARSGGPNAKGATAEGVDAAAGKKHLMDVARRLDVHGRSTMNKDQLVTAIERANRRETRSQR